jgi:hypothetical protein
MCSKVDVPNKEAAGFRSAAQAIVVDKLPATVFLIS